MLIIHGTIATMGENGKLITDGALYIEDGLIAAIGSTPELRARYPEAEVLDAEGRLVLPGLICAHTHFYGAFARGMALPGEPPTNFPEILERLWWRLDRTLRPEDVRASALVCLVDAIKHGTTTLIDHHASPRCIDGSLDVIAEAVLQAGVRACLCYEVTDRGGKEEAQAGIAENARFIKKCRGEASRSAILGNGAKFADEGLQLSSKCSWGCLAPTGMMGLHASLTLSDATLEAAVGTARELGVGCHIHVAEDKADQRDSLKKSGLRVVERLEKLGVLGEHTIAAHCVHVDAFEVDILRETGTRVVHNPRSNMNNAVGTADVPFMLRRHIPVGLGNDGFSNNMFVEMHAAYLIHKLGQGDPRAMPADTVLRMAFAHNGETAAKVGLPAGLGTLTVGAPADVILVDYVPPTPLTAGNLPWHIIFGVDGTGVDTTIVGGKVLMRGKELLTLDEERICAEARELARKVWARI